MVSNEELQTQIDDLQRQVIDLGEAISLTYREKLRLTNALNGSKTYYVSDSSGGAVTRKLTFKDGILTSET